MKKHKVLTHLREVIGLKTYEFSSIIDVPENDVIAIEQGTKAITPKILHYYTGRLNIAPSIMDALFKDFGESNRFMKGTQDAALYVLLKYLDFGKWMCSFNETHKI